ncbi:MAG: ATP synthase F1 subunit epsilon [Pseudomonadota bacterium]
MAEMLTFELVAPERKLASAEAEAVTIPGAEGDITPGAHHAAFLTTLRPGFVTVIGGDAAAQYFVTGGFAEISGNTVSVLAEEAFEAGEIDRAWLDGRIGELEGALDQVAEDRKMAEAQRINDFKALAEQIG